MFSLKLYTWGTRCGLCQYHRIRTLNKGRPQFLCLNSQGCRISERHLHVTFQIPVHVLSLFHRLTREIQSTVTAAVSWDGRISVLNNCLSWSVNAHLSHSNQWFNIYKLMYSQIGDFAAPILNLITKQPVSSPPIVVTLHQIWLLHITIVVPYNDLPTVRSTTTFSKLGVQFLGLG